MILIICVILFTLAGACNATPCTPVQHPSYSFMLWDWTSSALNFNMFKERVDQCKEAGFDTIDITVAWKEIELQPSKLNFALIDERVDYIKSKGMKVRLRVNVSFSHGWPDWFPGAIMTAKDGSQPTGVLSPFAHGTVDHWNRLAAKVADHFKDKVDCYMPGFGMHMEIKYGAWISYEPEAVRSFRVWLQTRYGSIDKLNADWNASYASFDAVEAPVPKDPCPKPDLSQPVIDFIQFREDALAYATDRFIQGFKEGYPKACVSVQLGESYRKESASMSNQEYYRYSRLADEIVHSYDFYPHPPNQPYHAFESVSTFIGTTRKPIVVEFDGPILFDPNFGYTDNYLTGIAKACVDAGASGIHVSNYCDTDPRPIKFVQNISKMVKNHKIERPEANSLFYISKWTIYTDRRADNSLHEQIYGYYKKLSAKGGKLRIISDENLLHEDLTGYNKIYVSYSPVMSEKAYNALNKLATKIPMESDGEVEKHLIQVR